MSVTFNGSVCQVAGLELPAPLTRGGQVKLFDATKLLTHDELVAIAKEVVVPTHPLIPTYELMVTVGSSLQKRWFQNMGDVPANVERNYVERWRTHERLIKDLNEKGETMVKKAKEKKAKAPKAEQKALTFSVLKSKVEGSAHAKKVADKEVTAHVPLVLQLLLTKPEKAWSLAEVFAGVKETKRYKTKEGTVAEGNVRNDLRALEKEGLVKVAEA